MRIKREMEEGEEVGGRERRKGKWKRKGKWRKRTSDT